MPMPVIGTGGAWVVLVICRNLQMGAAYVHAAVHGCKGQRFSVLQAT